MDKTIRIITILLLLMSCKSDNDNDNAKESDLDTYYTELYRPQFHFSPKANWMNDPNGLVYNKGTYHLYYQYYPDSTVWGPMHWGHATSSDLLNWKHQPVALYPDSLGYIFSGSAVIDENNSSNFGSVDEPPMVSIFTHHDINGERNGTNNFQYQSIAYSLDNGTSFEKYTGNPVIKNEGIKDFRDPKVFWHEGSNKWVMVLVAGDHAKIYNSDDLKSWELLSEFGQDFGAHGGVWECPDLFRLKVEDSEEERWVLLVSINPGAPNGGSGTQYFVGNFNGKVFRPDHLDTRWLDYGTDNYAGVTYNHAPKGKRIFIGWMSNWGYAQITPTKKWRSAMTIPRELSLYEDAQEIKLRNYPIENLSELYTNDKVEIPDDFDNPILLKTTKRKGADIKFNADLSKPLQVRLSNGKAEGVTFTVNPGKETLSLDRSKSGSVSFNEDFAAKKQTQPYITKTQLVEVRMLVDASSIEVFVEKGKYVFTSQIFPIEKYSILNINTIGTEAVQDLEINLIKSIWTDEE